ncbi:MAG: class I SAM-dependent methyltransferase [Simkaniaceae bacterium]|nr:class I SAM-dependent methyltransferase [Candidatus Sacchlamyda saccharinae]
MAKQSKTSWESSASWYDGAVGQKGHYYHEHVILPKLLKLMDLKKGDHLLDLACGQGILSRAIPKQVKYTGIDIAKSLIEAAKKRSKNPLHSFFTQDVTKALPVSNNSFTHATIVLALQNIENPLSVLKNVSKHLKAGGTLYLVLNHPCFRIPRLSHWGIDETKKLQYRRMDSYLSTQKIPIQMHPGKKQEQTWSFHHSLSEFTKMLFDSGFAVSLIEEWVSDKKSTGGKARMENRARKEFPLFMTLICKKL